MLKRLLRAFATPSLVLVLAACAGGGPPDADDVAPMWAAEIDRILAASPSELERRALTDGVISDAELGEAMNAFKNCMEALPYGFTVELRVNGSYEVAPLDAFYDSFDSEEAGDAAYLGVVAECESGTISTLGPLYAAMRDNPTGETPIQLIRECFIRHDVPDGAELADDAFAELVESSDYAPSTPWARSCLINSESDVLLDDTGMQVEGAG